MNKYNPDIHHRHSIRLKGYDYSQAGMYFITICVQDKKCLFGEIFGVDVVWVKNFQPPQEMILNPAGKIADDCWLEIPKHFPNVVLHEHIIMPNHVHGIIELKRIDHISNQIGDIVGTRHVVSLPGNFDIPVGTSHVMSLQNDDPDHPIQSSYAMAQQNQFSKPIPGSISVIIQQYKSSVTRIVNKNNVSHLRWQSRFYEHIIRNDQSYEMISDYIINNPQNWKDDDLFPTDPS
jgi:putative transposase